MCQMNAPEKRSFDANKLISKLVKLGLISLVTAGVGEYLTGQFQRYSSDNQRKYEMHRVRLDEAKALQKDILETANARLYWLQDMYLKLDHDPSEGMDDNQWQPDYKVAKLKWDTNMMYWHSKLDVLFGEELASELVHQGENELSISLPAGENISFNSGSGRLKSLNRAFVDMHNNLDYLRIKCLGKSDCKERYENMRTAKKQMLELFSISNCFAHKLSGRLLVDPYGPEKVYVSPRGCDVN